MARITIQDVKSQFGLSDSYDIANAIRNSSSDSFQSYVPLADKDNVLSFGAGIMTSQTVMNEFLVNLVDRIGPVIVRNVSLTNPLKKFKKGEVPLGRTIEEIFTDITKGAKYDPYDAENTVFKRTIPNVKTLYHERNRQDRYDQTISQEQLKTAFVSWGAFDNFVVSTLNAVYNTAEVEEYEYMKMLIDNYYAKGFFTVVNLTAPTTETAAKEFIKKARAIAERMTMPQGSREFNSLAVRTRCDMNDLHIFMTPELKAELDVDVMASAFNISRADLIGNITLVDGFGSLGLEAVIVDKEFFQVYDNLYQMETIRNPKGLYWNSFLHVWQTLSTSRFANAVAFVSGTVPAVTQVIVSPTIATLRAGDTFEFTGYVRQTDSATHALTWSVAGSTASTTLASGTAIDADGKLTVGALQTGELLVTAKSVGTGVDIDGAGSDNTDVIGESLVTILPAS